MENKYLLLCHFILLPKVMTWNLAGSRQPWHPCKHKPCSTTTAVHCIHILIQLPIENWVLIKPGSKQVCTLVIFITIWRGSAWTDGESNFWRWRTVSTFNTGQRCISSFYFLVTFYKIYFEMKLKSIDLPTVKSRAVNCLG